MAMSEPRTRPHHWVLAGLGLGALLVGATAFIVFLVIVGLLIAPLAVWLAWNVLDFAAAIGAPELGFWGIVLLTLFLISGFGGRLVIALLVWLFDPAWLAGSATLNWPQPSLRTFVALVILLLVAQVPAHHRAGQRSAKPRRQPSSGSATHDAAAPGEA
jgi:hypothetical protein